MAEERESFPAPSTTSPLLMIRFLLSAIRTTSFVSLLVALPLFTLGQKVTASKRAAKPIDLSDKMFVLLEEGEIAKTQNDLTLYLLFHKKCRATFRVKKGTTDTKDHPLCWRFVGDSLYVQNRPIKMTAEGKGQPIDRVPTRYAVEKTPTGYLLKERDGQAFWSERR